MRRKIVLAIVLCLFAALTIGTAPALAASGCTCHTTEPPTASAAHAPFVVGVDCTACHTDWTVPHPDVGANWLWLFLSSRDSTAGCELTGWLGVAFPLAKRIPHPNVAVYLQQRLRGASEFTDLTQATTDTKGNFAFMVPSAPPFATYRAIAQGHVVSGGFLFKPRATTLLPTPKLTATLRGVKDGMVKLGRSLRLNGSVAPTDLGAKVTIRVKKWADGDYVARLDVERSVTATGTYAWTFKPGPRGRYVMRVRILAVEGFSPAATPIFRFRVK